MENLNLLSQSSSLILIIILSLIFVSIGVLYSKKNQGLNNYLVANRNGGNYDITQGLWRGAAVNWQNNFNAQQLQDLNQAADNFTQWANQHNPQLIRVLMVFLTDVNRNPVDIRAGGRRKKKRKKKRKRYKSFKKSNRKLNRTIKLR